MLADGVARFCPALHHALGEGIHMETHGVTVQELRALCGPNLYSHKPVLYVLMDIGPYENLPSNSFAGCVDRLTAWLPGLHKHECGIGRPGGFVERLNGGTYLA